MIVVYAAHPRVGGENLTPGVNTPGGDGSSPRGRGKQSGVTAVVDNTGLIPAWAGKTHEVAEADEALGAHPRVGGENISGLFIDAAAKGSSPRGRGKRQPNRPGHRRSRLIPAWAGKTRMVAVAGMVGPAHPRVGGENQSSADTVTFVPGSSPRGRGKPQARRGGTRNQRLIPAWAGKTC